MSSSDYLSLPPDLPVPVDDGAADHLLGMALPSITLAATDGSSVDLSSLPARTVVYAYPRTGRPGQPLLVADWDEIPGARGCTPETCGFRDHHSELAAAGAAVFGLSTQDTAYQQELVTRLALPFPVLSDAALLLTRALPLPSFEVAGLTLIKRITLLVDDGVVSHVWYPVFPPDRHADDVLAFLRAQA
jgi:peroxiredoxin (alkyl hydroperoxide reductase subunit C)